VTRTRNLVDDLDEGPSSLLFFTRHHQLGGYGTLCVRVPCLRLRVRRMRPFIGGAFSRRCHLMGLNGSGLSRHIGQAAMMDKSIKQTCELGVLTAMVDQICTRATAIRQSQAVDLYSRERLPGCRWSLGARTFRHRLLASPRNSGAAHRYHHGAPAQKNLSFTPCALSSAHRGSVL
jgi:hypothetical protein